MSFNSNYTHCLCSILFPQQNTNILSLCFTVLEEGGGRIGDRGSISIDAGSASGGPGGERSVAAIQKDEAFGKHLVSTFIVPKLRESVKEILDNALQGKETSNYELEIKTKTNEFRYLLVNATTRRNAENKIIGGKYNNITLRCKILRIIIAESSLLPDIQ